MKLPRSLFLVGLAGLVMAGCGLVIPDAPSASSPRATSAMLSGPQPVRPSWMIKELNARMTPRTAPDGSECESWELMGGTIIQGLDNEIGFLDPASGVRSIAYVRTCGTTHQRFYVPNKFGENPCFDYATPNRTYPASWTPPCP